jgi:hypothetical protein
MTIDYFQLGLVGLGLVVSVIGWFFRKLWDGHDKLKEDFSRHREQLPKEYVSTSRLETMFDKFDTKLDRLFDKIDSKMDKP